MEVSSKPLRINDIKKEVLKRNKDLDEKVAELVAMLTMDLIEEFGEKYSNEIINKIINTTFLVASKSTGKKEYRMETIDDVLRKEELDDWTILRQGENDPTFVACPVMDMGNVIDTKRYIIVPANYNAEHYDFQGKMIGELIKLVTNSPYKIKNNNLETSSVYSKITKSFVDGGNN